MAGKFRSGTARAASSGRRSIRVPTSHSSLPPRAKDEQPQATQECLEPDSLYFFADAEAKDADTDSWFSRVGIDCSNLPPPSAAFQRNLDSEDDGSGSSRRPRSPRIPRGHRRFTWRLASAAQKTSLNAGRSEQPVYAGLESITFMRSNLREGDPDAQKKLVGELAAAAQKADGVERPEADDPLPLWLKGEAAPDEFEELGTALGDFMDAVESGQAQPIIDAAQILATKVADVPGKLADGRLPAYVKTAKDNATNALTDLKALAVEGPKRCEKLADDFVGSIRRKQLLILENVRNWEAYAEDLLRPETPPADVTVEKISEALVDALTDRIVVAVAGVSEDLGSVALGAERARNIIRDFENDIVETRITLEGQLAAFKATYNDTKPWSEARLGELKAKLDAERLRAFDAVRGAIEDTRIRLATEIDDLGQSIANALNLAMENIAGAGSQLKSDLTEVWSIVLRYVDVAMARINGVLKNEDGADQFQQLDVKLADLQQKAHAKLGAKYDAAFTALRGHLAAIKTFLQTTYGRLEDLKDDPQSATFANAVDQTVREGERIVAAMADAAAEAQELLRQLNEEMVDEAIGELRTIFTDFARLTDTVLASVRYAGAAVDDIVDDVATAIGAALQSHVLADISELLALIDGDVARLEAQVDRLRGALGADGIRTILLDYVVEPAIASVLAPITDDYLKQYQEAQYKRLKTLVGDTSGYLQKNLDGLTDAALGSARDDLVALCGTLAGGLSAAYDYLNDMAGAVGARAAAIEAELKALIDAGQIKELIARARSLEGDIRQISNDIATSAAAAESYGNRVLDAMGNLGSGNIGTVPGNILRLYAAAASAPALPNLDFARERLGYYYNQLNDIIDTTPVEAWFGRLGDELKALGLSLPFNKIGDRLIPDDLSTYDISRIFKNFGGLKLDKLFKGYKLPAGAKDAVKVTHAFDKRQFRAWVQIDVDLPISGRRSLFCIGPFQLDFVNSQLLAQVRLEASKDSDKVEQTGRANLGTNIEAVIAGQPMVMLQKVAVKYEKSTGLKVEFDPKNIKLNSAFQFIQDTLGSLFPDEIGGLKVIKDRGIPVGVEHEFSMPPVSLMYATSGVSNIQISNRFALVAFPDFVISDRFCLSRPDMPFIFSIFIIGGTGYITVDTEYRPFKSQLMVVVEAAAGGSASLGFAFGPVTGSVFITLSIALAYRKLIGSSGGGLTVSLVLLIAGNVNVAGIIDVYIGLLLRMSYRDNGQIDATGTLTITIRISRFFKIKVRANVQYKLRGGKSTTTTSVDSGAEITDERLAKAKEQADKLLKARG